MTVKIISSIISIGLIVFIISSVRKNKVLETESIFWVAGSTFSLLLTLFPQILKMISNWIGIQYPPATFFLIVIIFLTIICFRQFNMISKNTYRTIELIQRLAILENELEQLQASNPGVADRSFLRISNRQ